VTPEQYLDALLTLPGLYNPLVSLDGRRVAWTWFRTGPAADVYAAPTDGSAPAVRLTESLDNTRLVSWTPDGAAVIVAQDHDGNERLRLFRVDLARPGVMVPLTEDDPNYVLHGGQ
jgi:Tol biopolymer transport system component